MERAFSTSLEIDFQHAASPVEARSRNIVREKAEKEEIFSKSQYNPNTEGLHASYTPNNQGLPQDGPGPRW